ncbi:hypothetical protein BCR35DRAFT_335247 [Leucosporidium creatinivorum]|uniref:MYND-type domain-containing protein n=1 Tax=Leucosporidium creatinivorum TaxID=106004 RepID=A0A1Y2DFK8_9BASI|nr:hypothetical protein BCR35DRAFT_335247 [Leucosporidium creatinivorum]
MHPQRKFPAGAAFSCWSCHQILGDRTGQRVLWCSRCCVTPYCSKACQVKDWSLGGHKKDCRALEQSYRQAEEATLAQPAANALTQQLRTYSIEISPEVCILALRSALNLGKAEQRNHAHLLELYFNYNGGRELLRQRFEFTHASVVPFEVGLAGARRNPANAVVFEGLPTLENVQVQQRQKEHDSATVAVLFRATDVVSGKQAVIINPDQFVRFKTFEFIPAQLMTINASWEATFRYALSRPSTLQGHLLVLLDLFGSEEYNRAKGAVWNLGAEKKLKPTLFRKMAEMANGQLDGPLGEPILRALGETRGGGK